MSVIYNLTLDGGNILFEWVDRFELISKGRKISHEVLIPHDQINSVHLIANKTVELIDMQKRMNPTNEFTSVFRFPFTSFYLVYTQRSNAFTNIDSKLSFSIVIESIIALCMSGVYGTDYIGLQLK